ncbi:MAG: hypothetical protein U1F33_17575 [Alphaproteobacteria bacterium]
MKALPLALGLALMSHASFAADGAFAVAESMQSASITLTASAPHGSTVLAANSVAASFNGSAAPVTLLQNSGDTVVQNGGNALARAVAGPSGPAVAEALGTQITHVALDHARIEAAGGINSIAQAFNGASAMVNVVQNTGNNVAQNAQNALALVIRRP